MNKFRLLFLFILMSILIFSIAYPNIYWIINPGLTKMELVIKFGYLIPIAIISGLASGKISNG